MSSMHEPSQQQTYKPMIYDEFSIFIDLPAIAAHTEIDTDDDRFTVFEEDFSEENMELTENLVQRNMGIFAEARCPEKQNVLDQNTYPLLYRGLESLLYISERRRLAYKSLDCCSTKSGKNIFAGVVLRNLCRRSRSDSHLCKRKGSILKLIKRRHFIKYSNLQNSVRQDSQRFSIASLNRHPSSVDAKCKSSSPNLYLTGKRPTRRTRRHLKYCQYHNWQSSTSKIFYKNLKHNHDAPYRYCTGKGHSDSQAPGNPPTSASKSSKKSNTRKRKKKTCTDENEGQEEDGNSSDISPDQELKGSDGKSNEKKIFACTLFKADPGSYMACRDRKFEERKVKEHLKNGHFGQNLPQEIINSNRWADWYIHLKKDEPDRQIPTPMSDFESILHVINDAGAEFAPLDDAPPDFGHNVLRLVKRVRQDPASANNIIKNLSALLQVSDSPYEHQSKKEDELQDKSSTISKILSTFHENSLENPSNTQQLIESTTSSILNVFHSNDVEAPSEFYSPPIPHQIPTHFPYLSDTLEESCASTQMAKDNFTSEPLPLTPELNESYSYLFDPSHDVQNDSFISFSTSGLTEPNHYTYNNNESLNFLPQSEDLISMDHTSHALPLMGVNYNHTSMDFDDTSTVDVKEEQLSSDAYPNENHVFPEYNDPKNRDDLSNIQDKGSNLNTKLGRHNKSSIVGWISSTPNIPEEEISQMEDSYMMVNAEDTSVTDMQQPTKTSSEEKFFHPKRPVLLNARRQNSQIPSLNLRRPYIPINRLHHIHPYTPYTPMSASSQSSGASSALFSSRSYSSIATPMTARSNFSLDDRFITVTGQHGIAQSYEISNPFQIEDFIRWLEREFAFSFQSFELLCDLTKTVLRDHTKVEERLRSLWNEPFDSQRVPYFSIRSRS